MALKYKICGINYRENLQELILLKPDFVGHIFYPKSPRLVPPENMEFMSTVDYQDTQKVAVMVNPTIECIQNIFSKENFRLVQLHGDETAAFCREVKTLFPDLQIIKAFPIAESWDQQILENYLDSVDYFLFDTKTEQYGGSGRSFNWELLKDYRYNLPYFISGGLNPENIRAAIDFAASQPKCYALDLNSGFEISPGLKSIKLLKDVL